jgi:anti-sigma B factor antagonist
MDVSLTFVENAAVVTATGDLDLAGAERLRAVLLAGLGLRGEVHVDLAAARFVDSTIVGVLVGALVRARSEGKQLAVVNAAPAVTRVFRLLGVTRMLTPPTDTDVVHSAS